MADNDMKAAETLDKISKTLQKLDDTLSKEDSDKIDGKNVRAWFEERMAVHEVKKSLHEAGKYDKFNQKSYDDFIKDYEKVVKNIK